MTVAPGHLTAGGHAPLQPHADGGTDRARHIETLTTTTVEDHAHATDLIAGSSHGSQPIAILGGLEGAC